jgi:RNA polymerase sigma-70 factor (ECF subfamily)
MGRHAGRMVLASNTRVIVMELLMPFESSLTAKEESLEQFADLDGFLKQVEASAFRIAMVSVRDREEALDIVQDAMMRLATRYARRPSEEWRPLFYRILRNRIRDWGRRRAVSQRVMSFFSGADQDFDPVAAAPGPASDDPSVGAEGVEILAAMEAALRQLSERQRQVFMLRNFENLDVAETAVVMGVTDGSVKTHYSRAVSRLRELLGEHWHE